MSEGEPVDSQESEHISGASQSSCPGHLDLSGSGESFKGREFNSDRKNQNNYSKLLGEITLTDFPLLGFFTLDVVVLPTNIVINT